MSLIDIFINTGHVLLILNIIFYFKSYHESPVAFRIFTFYLLTILSIQLTSKYLRFYKINNIYLSHYYFISQFVFLSIFFRHLLKKQHIKKIITLILAIVLITIGVYYFINPSKYYEFNIFEIVITSIPLLVYGFLFFIQKIENASKEYIYVVSGFFLYILCSTLLFTTGNIKADVKKIIWYSNAILYIVYQVLIFTEWYKHFRKNSSITV